MASASVPALKFLRWVPFLAPLNDELTIRNGNAAVELRCQNRPEARQHSYNSSIGEAKTEGPLGLSVQPNLFVQEVLKAPGNAWSPASWVTAFVASKTTSFLACPGMRSL
ncbi:hypothetical protein ACRRTK_002983 [Alexandromys fortis]